MEKIDFVITWVDGSDPKWLSEKNSILGKTNDINNGVARYRDWDNLKYLFRSIEKNAPWVNKVYFVTWGHIPKWLNTDNPKLIIVNHKDFIPKEYLPTYSSHTIELNLHRIKGLSEKFVYFNDDTFILRKVTEDEFFHNGKPVDEAILTTIIPDKYILHEHILMNNVYIINKYYQMHKVISSNIKNWFNIKYGFSQIRTLLLLPWNNFPGFKFNHLPSALLKSTYVDLWNKEFEIFDKTCKNKVRSITDVNQYVLKSWQIVNKNFYPMKKSFGYFFDIDNDYTNKLKYVSKKKYKIVCINDTEYVEDFEKAKKEINSFLEKIFPDKSQFERRD